MVCLVVPPISSWMQLFGSSDQIHWHALGPWDPWNSWIPGILAMSSMVKWCFCNLGAMGVEQCNVRPPATRELSWCK